MVFSGKPSSACLACRIRKLKCDRQLPSCSQCLRKDRQCSGYRDPDAIRFRDDTSRFTNRLLQETNVAELATRSPVGEVLVHHSLESSFNVLPPSLSSDSHQIAMSYFLQSYIKTTPYEEYLPSFDLSTEHVDDSCSLIATATAYAALAQYSKQRSHLAAAHGTHVQALSRINQALRSPQEVLADRTLVTVLLFALFESIVSKTIGCSSAWRAHVNGLVALLQHRGDAYFDSRISLLLFEHAVKHIMASCFQQGIEAPTEIVRLTRSASEFLEDRVYSNDLLPLVNSVARLKSESAKALCYHHLSSAQEIDKQLVACYRSLFQKLAPYFEDTESAKTHPWAYQNHVHRFKSISLAKSWTALQFMRIWLANFVANGATGQSRLPFNLKDCTTCNNDFNISELPKLYSYAEQIMEEACVEIFAALPSFLDGDSIDSKFPQPARSLLWVVSIIVHTRCTSQAALERANQFLDKLASDLDISDVVHAIRNPPEDIHAQVSWVTSNIIL